MTSASEERVERLIERSRAGDLAAGNEVLAGLYLELHEIAATLVGKRPAGLTLQATALVHEAWLKLNRTQSERIADRNHFLNLAARAMRCVLVDHARARSLRGGVAQGEVAISEPLDQVVLAYEEHAYDLEALDRALVRLAEFDERMARGVELRFFAGLDAKDTAAALDMPMRTFERDWAATKVWLMREMR
ncbi:MAG TPA: ECF-type sigma factor [Planctomycetota bacterium]|nr:ECF-type sigma factor [Planctomycetota bacterium]